ncbi:hypothetical protein [Sphingomicrobium nitratireducens]|uniref:hypothetical protein n=1 Tax=Sphingomicrobium nitratireducens TaxID=2964666 RepID=UPI00223FB08F|nr:hypothetical protein [Sphingomicrobium nitratireducens]
MRMSKSILFGAAAAALVATQATASPLAKVKKVIEADHHQSYKSDQGHEFMIKNVKFEKHASDPNLVYVDGRITHHLTARPDDKYHYCMTMTRDGDLVDMAESINRGGFTKVVTKAQSVANNKVTRGMASGIAGAIGRTMPGGELTGKAASKAAPVLLDIHAMTGKTAAQKIGGTIGGWIDGDWTGDAREIAMEVAVQSAKALKTGEPSVSIKPYGTNLDPKIISQCPRRKDKSLH